MEENSLRGFAVSNKEVDSERRGVKEGKKMVAWEMSECSCCEVFSSGGFV